MSEVSETTEMLGCIFRGVGNIQLARMPVPIAGEGEVVVRVSKVGICGSDLKAYKRGGDIKPGTVPGHEFSGVVSSVGDGVKGMAQGDRVTVNPIKSLLGIYRDGAFAEYVKIPQARLDESIFLLPDSIDDEQAAMIEPLAVALRGVKRCRVAADTRVVVQGLGTIGLCALLILKNMGVKTVIGVDSSGVRLDLAQSMGAVPHALGEGDLDQTVHEVYGTMPGTDRNAGVDLVVDATGNESALRTGVRLLRLGGEMLLLGTYAGEAPVDLNTVVAKELRLVGSMAYREEFAQALALVAQGIDVAPLISHRFLLTEIQQALDTSLNVSEAVKVLLDVN